MLLTADKNMRYQQNLTGRRIALVVLSAPQWPLVRLHMERIARPHPAAMSKWTFLSGGSGAPRREHTPAGQKQDSRTAAQAYALGTTTPRQPGTRASSAKLNALLASKLATARAWNLKETFSCFWKYKFVIWAGGFLDYWCARAMRSRLEPMKKVARMLRAHEPLILNWFRAQGEISHGAVEGLNNKIRVVTRRSYGFRTFDAMEIALYHNLGRLPEPESPHRFC